MSIVVAVSGTEGIALAADSRTVERRIGFEPEYSVSSDSAEKIFVLDGRLGVATYGIAMVGPRTIRELIEEFEVPGGGDVNACATTLGDFFWQHLSETTQVPRRELPKTIDLSWPLGFVVAGFDEGELGTLIDVKVRPTGAKAEAAGLTTANPGVIVRGHGDAVRRMIDGVDWQAVREQRIELDASSREELEELRYDLTDSPTTEGAALRAEFYVETQIKMQDFSAGTVAKRRVVRACGGPVRVMAVGRDGASWIQNPSKPVVIPKQNVAVLERAGEVG